MEIFHFCSFDFFFFLSFFLLVLLSLISTSHWYKSLSFPLWKIAHLNHLTPPDKFILHFMSRPDWTTSYFQEFEKIFTYIHIQVIWSPWSSQNTFPSRRNFWLKELWQGLELVWCWPLDIGVPMRSQSGDTRLKENQDGVCSGTSAWLGISEGRA